MAVNGARAYRSASQTSPFTDTTDANNPSYGYAQRRMQGQPNVAQAVSGVPVGGVQPNALQNAGTAALNGVSSLFANAGGATGSEPGGIAGPKQSTQPVGSPMELPGQAGGQGQAGSGGSNQDKFIAMLNDPANKGKHPQDLIDQWNGMGNEADSSGLSSKYGSSPAYYGDNNTIGLPGAYLTQDSSGKWSATQRTPGSGGGGGGGFNSDIINNAIMGTQLGSSAASGAQQGGTPIWQTILQALQGQSQLQ